MRRLVLAVLVITIGGWLLWQIMPEPAGDAGDTMHAVLLGAWGLLVLAGIFGSGIGIGRALRDLTAWAVIALALTALYVFRYDVQDFGSQLTAGLIPGSPISRVDDEGRIRVTLVRDPSGHFEADADVNGASVRFVVDTGASTVVLSARDASRAGLDPADLVFDVPTRTANGIGRAARVTLEELRVGAVVRRDLDALVAHPGSLSISLLGQNFLESLSSYEKRGDRLTLRD